MRAIHNVIKEHVNDPEVEVCYGEYANHMYDDSSRPPARRRAGVDEKNRTAINYPGQSPGIQWSIWIDYFSKHVQITGGHGQSHISIPYADPELIPKILQEVDKRKYIPHEKRV